MDAKILGMADDFSPQWIVDQLDKTIVGQVEAKRSIAAAMWWNRQRSRMGTSGFDLRNLPPKHNVMLIGPTGTGKTTLAKAAAAVAGVPVFVTPATSYSITGLVGLDPEDMVAGLLDAAGGDLQRAAHGIVVIDETDKLKKRDWGSGADVGGESIQQALLAILESAEPFVRSKNYDRVRLPTDHITFIGTGVFDELQAKPGQVHAEQLHRLGFLPEFIGRFSMRVRMEDVDLQQLKSIAGNSLASPVKQLQNLFELYGIELIFEPSAVEAIVELGLGNGLGVRGLNQAVWERCHGLVSDLPQLIEASIAKIVLDRRAIENGEPWKIPGDLARGREVVTLDDIPQTHRQIEWHPQLPKVSDTTKWTSAHLVTRLNELRPRLKYPKATFDAKSFWQAFEKKHDADLRPVVRLGECLLYLNPTGSIQEFYETYKNNPQPDERCVIFEMLAERYRDKKDRKTKTPKKAKADDIDDLEDLF